MSTEASTFDCYMKNISSLYAINSADNENFSTLMSIAYKAPEGEKTMNSVAFMGYKFMYQQLFGLNGCCDYENKTVNLDSFHTQQDLAPILIHECTHINQVERLKEAKNITNVDEYLAKLNTYDFFKINKAFEADACAHQAALTYQLKDIYPEMYKKASEIPMVQAYAREMDSSHDETKAMQQAFTSWYSFAHYLDAYEEQYIKQLKFNAENNPGSKEVEHISNEELSKICLADGKTYITADFFDLKENNSISQKGKDSLASLEDTSIEKMAVRSKKTASKLENIFSQPRYKQSDYVNFFGKPDVDLEIKTQRVVDVGRMINLVNNISRNSEFGKAVLESAAKAGYGLTFEHMKDGCGYCDPDTKTIALNQNMSDDLLTVTLAHEARHAQQFANGAIQDFGQLNLKSEIMYTRAEEADAETAAAATCYEMKLNNVKGPWEIFEKDSEEIATGFKEAIPYENAPINNQMLQGAFNGWYKDTRIVNLYDQDYYQDVMKEVSRKGLEKEYPYNKDVSSDEIVGMFCKNKDGNCYFEDSLTVLYQAEKLTVSEDTIKVADDFFKKREEKLGIKKDSSYKDLPIRGHKESGKQKLNLNSIKLKNQKSR
ncbi:MAG: hypothetical protein MJ247_02175 [Alphaproteobacteria bacterium]|nr:hypothetical protein [Alphaproteobacteria bacterium]